MRRSLFHLVPLFFCYLFFFAFALPFEPQRTVGSDSTEGQSLQSLQTRGLPYFISPPSPSSPPPLSLPPPELSPHPFRPQEEPPRPPQRSQTQQGHRTQRQNPRPLQRPAAPMNPSQTLRLPVIQIFFPQCAGVPESRERTQDATGIVRRYLQSSSRPPYPFRRLTFRNHYLSLVEDQIHFKMIDFHYRAYCNPSCDGTAFLVNINGSTFHHGDLVYNGTVPTEFLSTADILNYAPLPPPPPPHPHPRPGLL
ncbi:hypothetical protein GGU10DRAFT_35008 [Lentinula aff. detonsa]|uniref:Uncharacterized protein n=1 Tax=Lentinula aff. detonsa TaxID=2804958 RepID=A0AA38L4U6_9AGAR|nr:hypothetical protein GGU10DRAFT_35008 [Lentinula aff. detonsa]